jgi:hypothetical protein
MFLLLLIIYSVDVRMINECGMWNELELAEETEVLTENPPRPPLTTNPT